MSTTREVIDALLEAHSFRVAADGTVFFRGPTMAKVKYKTVDLEGALLDAAVAKAEGFALRRHPGGFDLWCRPDDPQFSEAVEPGYWLGDESFRTIIERERIALLPSLGDGSKGPLVWSASVGAFSYFIDSRLPFDPRYSDNLGHSGPTPLIAAMRAFCASRFGEEVEL